MDHKDITDYRNIPTIQIPSHMVRQLTPAECITKAEECEERAQRWMSKRDHNWDLKQAQGFRALAVQRA